jgi:putative membrane protein
MEIKANLEKKYTPAIIAVAILIPIVVSILAYIPSMELLGEFNYHILPLLNAILNGTTFVVLLLAFWAIRKNKRALHRMLMTSAIVLSVLFLVFYVLYHAAVQETRFGGEGFVRTVYYFVLITHILLSAAIVPMVLMSYVRALAGKYDRHRKIARITWPLWLYVTFTGVVVYLMISPYYPQQ